MLQFLVLGEGAGTARVAACDRFPFVIGRSSGAHLQVVASGVWDAHAQVDVDPQSGKLLISPVGEALLLINGEPSHGKILLPNDEVHVGAVVLRVALSPVTQKSVKAMEAVVWGMLVLVTLAELFLILKL